MKRLFEKIKNDCAGAVTVLVTLLLIPAVLISGTGVDLARAYAAKSIVQDANQLAGNSALASYDAMLQDLYGLFAMSVKDEEFAGIVNRYIQTAIFGEEWKDTGPGTFQLFYGSDIQSTEIAAAGRQNLDNPDVLRRQIEDYAKYRAPKVIMGEILAALDAFDKMKKDADVVKKKMALDDRVEEIDKIYGEIYDCITNLNEAGAFEESAYESVNSLISGGHAGSTVMDIKSTIKNAYDARELYHTEESEERKADREKQFKGYLSNIRALINGGKVKGGWYMGDFDENGEYQEGKWNNEIQSSGLKTSLKKSETRLNTFIDGKNDSLSALIILCEQAEQKKSELSQQLAELEVTLNSGECSDELRSGMTEKDAATNKSTIDTYKDLLKYNLTAMANAMSSADKPQLQKNVEQLKNGIYYGKPDFGTDVYYSLDGLIHAVEACEVGYGLPQMVGRDEQANDALIRLTTIEPDSFSTLGVFLKFQDSSFDATHNREFYDTLKQLYGEDGGGKKKSYKSAAKKLIGNIQQALKDIFFYEPEGAWHYANASAEKADSDANSFVEKNWEKDPGAIKNALDDSILKRLGAGAETAVNKLLLLTYDSEMFSCYSTGKTEKGEDGRTSDGKPIPEINMNGIPLGIDVNYYYQSELEYLFGGNRADAIDNLKSVAGLIFLVRLVFNYVASFTIPTVKRTVAAVKASLAGLGPFAVAIGELVRLGLVLGESAIDVGRLKNGSRVELFKIGDHENDSIGGWRFSISGAAASALEQAKLQVEDEKWMKSDPTGFVYKDYMRLFLLLVDGDVLAKRTADLIEMNVTNVKGKIGSHSSRTDREAAMAKADMYLMQEAVTGVDISTTVEMKMIFLSMPFAQKGINGKIPPGTLELTVVDHRGY